MNKVFTGLFATFFCAILIGCNSDKACSIMDYSYIFPGEAFEETTYTKVYTNENNFTKGEQGIAPDSSSGNQVVLQVGAESIPFIDIRYPDGTNSWSNQAELTRLAQMNIESTGCKTSFRYNDYSAFRNIIASSPSYLHLALKNGMQDGGEKMWLIERIYDEDKFDVTDRPEWQCVRGLKFTFYKGGKGARVKIGAPSEGGACGVFEELFGTRSEVFATYSLEGEDQQELRITVPAVSDALKEQLTFHVIESAYDHLEISLTNGSAQIGYATLIPSSNE